MASVLLVSDFDGTLTKRDTTYLSFKSTRKFRKASQIERVDLLKEIKSIGDVYYNNYKTLVEYLLDECKMESSLTSEKLYQFLTAVDSFNINSRRNLANQKYFDDFVSENLDDLIEEIEFHPHAIETLENLQKQNNIICKILSVNWFPELLKASVDGVIPEDDIITSAIPLVRENQVDFGEVSTALGKGEWLRKWKNEYKSLSVYLGDSLTDLPALLEANYGVIFGSDKKIIEVADIFGIDVRPLSTLFGDSFDTECTSKLKCLYTTTSWEEVETLVKHLLNVPASA